MYSHLCSLHFSSSCFYFEGKLSLFLISGNLLQRAFFAAFFREILTCHLHEFLRNSRDDISASEKQFSGHIYYVSKHDFGLIEKLFVRRKVYCSTFLARIAYKRFIGRNFLARIAQWRWSQCKLCPADH